jgi:uncharacterized protein YeaO (DUF488 family)
MIQVKRVYEPPSPDDGARYLVERLWPRGIKKESLQMDAWIKEAAPSTELRLWFRHEPAKWDEFQRKYFRELQSRPEVLDPILKLARRGRVTLLYSARDAAHNNAIALKRYLEEKLRRPLKAPQQAGRANSHEPQPRKLRRNPAVRL